MADDAGEAVPEMDKLIKTLAGVDIMKDDTTFKSTYQILLEISKVWKDLDDTTQATLLEKMFGKQQGSVGASILNNMVEGSNAMATAMNSVGSSAKEQEAYMTSLEAKVNEFKETVTKQWSNAVNTDSVKGLVDTGTWMVDTYGNMNAIILQVVAGLALWKGSAIAATLANRGLVVSIANLGLSIKTAFMTNPFGWILTGASILIPAILKLGTSFEEQKKKVEDLTSKLDELNSEYDTLSKKGDLTASESKRLELLKAEISANQTILEQEQKKLYLKYQQEDSTGSNSRAGQYGLVESNLQSEINEYEKLDETNAKSLKQQDDMIAKKAKLIQSFTDEIETLQKFKDAGVKMSAQDEKRLEQMNLIIASYNKLNGAVNDTNEAIEASSTINASTSIDSMNTAVDSYVASLEKIEDAEKKVSDKQSLSYEEMTNLKDLYPELESAIYRTSDGWGIEASALDKIKTTAKETAIAQVKAEKEKTLAVLNGAKARIGIIVDEATTQQAFVKALLGNVQGSSQGVVMTDDQKNLMNQFMQFKKIANEEKSILGEINDISAGGIGGGSSSKDKSKSTPSPIDSQDMASAFIKSANAQVEITKSQEKSLERQIKLADSAKDYTKELELQKSLLANQTLQVSELQTANQKISAEASRLRSNSVYGEASKSWFDVNGESTAEYINLLESYAGKTDDVSKAQYKAITDLYDNLYKLKQGWYDNVDAVNTLTDAIESTRQSMKETTTDMYTQMQKAATSQLQKEISALKDQLDENSDDYINKKADRRIKRLNEELDALNEQEDTQSKLLAVEKNRIALEQAQSQNTTRVYKEGQGFVYDTDQDAVKTAQDNYDQSVSDWESYQKKLDIQEDIQYWEDLKQANEDSVNSQIDDLEALSDKWNDALDISDEAEMYSGSLDDILGTESDSYEERLELLDKFVEDYRTKMAELASINYSYASTTSSSSSGSKTVTAGSNGNAPAGTNVGDTVNTAGGHSYTVVGKGDTTKTTGGSYNSSSGLTSIKKYGKGTHLTSPELAIVGDEDEWIIPDNDMPSFIDLLNSNAMENMFNNMNVSMPNFDSIKSNTSTHIQLSIGDIHVSGVQDADSFSKAIIQQLPNSMIQQLYKK